MITISENLRNKILDFMCYIEGSTICLLFVAFIVFDYMPTFTENIILNKIITNEVFLWTLPSASIVFLYGKRGEDRTERIEFELMQAQLTALWTITIFLSFRFLCFHEKNVIILFLDIVLYFISIMGFSFVTYKRDIIKLKNDVLNNSQGTAVMQRYRTQIYAVLIAFTMILLYQKMYYN